MAETLRVALIHDYLTQFGGAEQVLAALQRMLPGSDIFTTLHDPDVALPGVDRALVRESRLGSIGWFRQHHRAALPLFPLAMRDLDRRLAGYDVLLADSSAWAHQVTPRAGQALLVYCHSPARFLYGDSDYLSATRVVGGAGGVFNSALAPLRWLDRRAFQRAHVVLANSTVVAGRLAQQVGIAARVLHPPITVAEFAPAQAVEPEDWYLVVSRLVPHKRVDVAIAMATRFGVPLKIIGIGRDYDRLRALAGPTVEFLGFQPRESVIRHLQSSRGLILPGVEDFGMTVVEAQAAGRPVIGINRGGARESIVDGETGVLFDEQTADSLYRAVQRLEGLGIGANACIAHARSFDEAVFRDGISSAITEARALARA